MGKKKNGGASPEEKGSENSKAPIHRDAVAKALGALGESAKVPALTDWVNENLGLGMNTRQVGLHRYHILPKKAKAMKRGRPPGSKNKVQPEAASNGMSAKAPKPAAGKMAMVAVEDMRVVKELVGRYGSEQVRQMLDVLAP